MGNKPVPPSVSNWPKYGTLLGLNARLAPAPRAVRATFDVMLGTAKGGEGEAAVEEGRTREGWGEREVVLISSIAVVAWP